MFHDWNKVLRKEQGTFSLSFPCWISRSQPLTMGDGLTTHEKAAWWGQLRYFHDVSSDPENVDSESFCDVGQGANQESKARLLFLAGSADSKQGFLQVRHGPGSSHMGTKEEGSGGRHGPRLHDPVATCIYISWRIMYPDTNSYPSWWVGT